MGGIRSSGGGGGALDVLGGGILDEDGRFDGGCGRFDTGHGQSWWV